MKDHLRQPCVLTELCKLFEDDTILARPSIGKRHNQIEVLILVAQETFQLVLGLLPFPQNVGQRFRQPHLTDAGIGFRLFQNNSCAGVRHERSEDVIDILLTQRFDCPFGCPCQLLVDVVLFAWKVRSERKRQHLTQKQLAERLGMNPRTIIDLETCQSNPKFETVVLVAKELNISVDAAIFPEMVNQTVSKTVVDFFAGKSEAEIEKFIALCKQAEAFQKDE